MSLQREGKEMRYLLPVVLTIYSIELSQSLPRHYACKSNVHSRLALGSL
jgi:hypothetical protein